MAAGVAQDERGKRLVKQSYLYWWISVVAVGNWKGKNVEPIGNMNVNGDSGTQILIGY